MSIKILVAGDYCPLGRTAALLKNGEFARLFNGFENLTKDMDYSIVNLECPITTSDEKIEKTGPCLKTDDVNALRALKYAGFNLLALANNHIQDYGSQGVIDTIKNATSEGFDIVGAGADIYSASLPLIKSLGGLQIAFVNIAENEFCAADDAMAGANTFDFINNTRTISELRKNVDKIVLIYHGGREHYQLPTPELRRRLRYFIECGVDAIVAHHTHCFSGFEYYNNKPIVYSLGNFIFDYKPKYQKGLWTEGMCAILNLEDDLFKVELIPFSQGRKDDFTLRLMQDKQKEIFYERVKELCAIIHNDRLFQDEWIKYLKTQSGFYLSSLYFKNIFLRAFFVLQIFPSSLLRHRHNKLLLNLIRCETHLEISKGVLIGSGRRSTCIQNIDN